MNDRVPPLTPWPLARLLDRIAREWETRGEIFSLSGRRFFRRPADVDLSCEVAGRRVATPLGPAAGPHTQLAQNIVLAWLAGGRSFELKTVQILDELDIERPCIDMESVGYNIEWSQELSLDQSLAEYAKSALLLEVLGRWEPLREILGDPGGHVFELSLGYDLAGIRSPRMKAFIDGLRAAGPRIDGLRRGVGEPFASLRDVPVDPVIARTATLSTFHGCPPDEIEGIVKHLMTEHGLDVTVKLNPTLLGLETVRGILHDSLDYGDVALVPEAFTQDLQFERALEMIHDLALFADREGREFGVKLTNTLVVENRRGVMPGDRMYLSGAPLHVLAVTLLDRLVEAMPGTLAVGGNEVGLPVAFSAGVNKDNLESMAALGLCPVTICSDLLRPGGYGRMAQGLRKLTGSMQKNGHASLSDLRRAAATAAAKNGHRDAVQALATKLAEPAGWAPYAREAVAKPLRSVDQDLRMFECVACNNCVTVCPNNAFLDVPSEPVAELESRRQYFVLAELCNDCGNCTTFCPERGQPHRIKPALYLDREAWETAGRQGFLVEAAADGEATVHGEAAGADRVARLLAGAQGLPLQPDRERG